MAKRFIDTGFFKDPFVRGLEGSLKGLYVYLFLDCSNAGLWDVELDVARLRCGVPDSISDSDLKCKFSSKIIEVENEQKWLIKNFVKIQHNGVLKKNNNAHISAINELLKYELLDEIEEGIYHLKVTLESPSLGSLSDPMVKVMVKEEGNGLSNGNGKVEPSKKFGTAEFKKILIDLGADPIHVDDWMKARQKKKATNSETSLKAFVNECNKNNYPIASAVKYSAEKGYAGFKYEWVLNENSNTNLKNPQSTTQSKASKMLNAHENVVRKFREQANGN